MGAAAGQMGVGCGPGLWELAAPGAALGSAPLTLSLLLEERRAQRIPPFQGPLPAEPGEVLVRAVQAPFCPTSGRLVRLVPGPALSSGPMTRAE